MKSRSKPKTSVALTVATAILLSSASAATVTWDANAATASQTDGTGVWLSPSQWWNGTANVTWTSGDDAIFGNTGAGGAVTLASPTTANSITFNSFTGTYTIGTAAQTITLNNGITKNTGSGAATIISPITMGAAQSWTNNSAGLLTVGTGAVTNGGFLLTLAGTGNTTVTSVISGASGLTKTDVGLATLSGANTYGGATTINGGVVAASALAGGGATSSIGNSSNAASNLVFGAPTATLRYTGAAASTDRGFTLSSGAGGGATIEASGTGALTLAAATAIAYGTTNETRTLTLGGTNIEANTFAKVLANNGSGVTSFVKNGAGQWALSGANTYTGGSTVNAGTLTFRNLASKASTGTHAFAAGTTLGLGVGALAFTTADIDNAFAGTMTGNLSNVTVTATTNIAIDTTLANLTYSSNIASASRGLTKLGANTLTLGANNAYTGVTTVAGGTLSVGTLANAGSNSSIGNFTSPGETGLVLAGGTLNYTGSSTTTNRGFTAIGGSQKIISVGTGVNLVLGASLKNESAGSTSGLTFSASGAGSSITISSMTITAGTSADFNLIGSVNPNVTIQNLNVTGGYVIHERTGTHLLNIGNIIGTGASGWLGNLNVTGEISGYSPGLLYLGGNVTLTGLSSFRTNVVLQQAGIYTYNSIKNVGGGASALGAPTTVAEGTITIGNGNGNPIFRYTGTGDVTDRVLNLKGNGGILTLEQAGTGILRYTGNPTAESGAKTLSFSGSTAGSGVFAGVIANGSGTIALSKTGTGTWTLSGANTYTGSTTITGGTLSLGANDVIPNASSISIGAATLNAATFTETLGTLAVTAAATINLDSGATLVFADSSAVAWPGTLNITGTLTPSSIRFGTTGSGLNSTQLGKITLNGTGLNDYTLNASGYLIYSAAPPDTTAPNPSPMTWATVPTALGSDSVTMTATTATDVSGVEYFFDETTGNAGGTDSGWQNSPTYIDNGLNASTSYTYTVTARDKSLAANPTAASPPASAMTPAPPLYTVWNVQIASQSGNLITTANNYLGGATENTANSTWNHVTSMPQTAMALLKSNSDTSGVTLDITGGYVATQNLLTGDKLFNSYIGGTINLSLKGLTMANSYDIVFYSDWWWKSGDPLPITQTVGSGLTGTAYLNRIYSGSNGNVPPLTRDTNLANVSSGAGNTGNWMRISGLVPTLSGELAFRLTDGNNTPFNGFQVIATPAAPRADMLSMSLASNPPSIQNAIITGTNVTLTVPYGTNVTSVAPTYSLWLGATCPVASGTARNFTTPQTYTITSSDSLVVKNYTVTVVVAPPLPEFTLSAPANWDGRTSITAQPVISNLSLLQANSGTNFTYSWSLSNVAATQTTSPSVMTLTRAQGNGPLLVTLSINNGTENVTRSTTINVLQPTTDPWVERTPLANEKPVTGQFFARNPFTNLGTIYYRGTQSGSPNDVFLKIYRTPSGGSEALYATHRQSLASGTYDFTATIDAGLFTYRVVYGTRTSAVDTDVATVTNLLCGDAFIISGQSNAQATDNSAPQTDTSDPWVKTYDATLGWGPAYAKPSTNWGSKVGFWGMKLAQDLVVQKSIPICIINGAVGGTMISQHQPNPVNRTVGDGTYDLYANLLNRVIGARLTHGIRGVFWHQGESDSSIFGPPLDPDHLFYEQNFLTMSSAWKQDYPNFQRYILFQVAPNPCGIGPYASEIRQVQRKLPRLFSNMSLMHTLGLAGYEGCHYSLAGYQNMAGRVLNLVDRDFYGATPSAAVTPPNLIRAYFTSSARTAIALQFDQPMSWSNFSLPNWHVNDVTNQVTSGSASGNTITLQLVSAASANSTLDYIKDTWNYAESTSTLLYGANAIPALTFANEPIEALSPLGTWGTSKGLSEVNSTASADPDLDGLANMLEFVLGGEPNPANPGSNSVGLLPVAAHTPTDQLIFTFKRKIVSVNAVDLSLEWSTDLSFSSQNRVTIGATTSTSNGVTVAVSSFDASTDNITVTLPETKAQNGKLFVRLRAVTP